MQLLKVNSVVRVVEAVVQMKEPAVQVVEVVARVGESVPATKVVRIEVRVRTPRTRVLEQVMEIVGRKNLVVESLWMTNPKKFRSI